MTENREPDDYLNDPDWPPLSVDECPQCGALFRMLGYEVKCPECGMIFYLDPEGNIVDADPSDYVDPWPEDKEPSDE